MELKWSQFFLAWKSRKNVFSKLNLRGFSSYFLSSILTSKEVNLGPRANSTGKGFGVSSSSMALMEDVRFISSSSSFAALMWLTLTDAVAKVGFVASVVVLEVAVASSSVSNLEKPGKPNQK